MITDEQRTDIIRLVVTATQAAPGVAVLAELEAQLDAGATMLELAESIAAGEGYSGDLGLYPDYLPDAVFANKYVTNLVGAEVAASDLADGIALATSLLNSGWTRAQLMIEAERYLNDPTTLDKPDFAPAAIALANQTEVAEYYSVDKAQDGDVAALQTAIAGVDSSDTAVADGKAAVDVVIADAAPLVDNLAALAAAQDNLAAWLLADGQDPATPEVDPPTPYGDLIVDYGTELVNIAGILTDAAYPTDTLAVQMAKTGAETAVRAAALDVQQALLDTADDNNADVAGLNAAIDAATAAAVNVVVTAGTATIATAEAVAELTTYNVLAPATKDITLVVGAALPTSGKTPTASATADPGTGAVDVIETKTSGALGLVFGVTEETHPGITALLATLNTENAAFLAEDKAPAAAAAALLSAQLIDVGAAADVSRSALGALVPGAADADYPTEAEISAQLAALTTAESNGRAALLAEIEGITFTTDAAANTDVEGFTTTAVAEFFITAGEKTAIDAAYAAELAGDSALLVPAANAAAEIAIDAAVSGTAGSDLAIFTTAYGVYEPLEAGDNPLIDAYAVLTNVGGTGTWDVANDDVDDFAEALADQNEMGLRYLTGATLNKAITDAEAVLAAQDVIVETVTTGLTATEDNDAYLLGTADGDIADFGDEGDDVIYLGEEVYVINDGDVADDGDDDVLEIFFAESTGGDTTVSIETSVFGSNTVVPEVITIVLTGVASADLSLDSDGFIVVV